MKFSSIFLFFLISSQLLFSNGKDSDFALLTIPKTGTFLMIKCLKLITKKDRNPIALGTKMERLHSIKNLDKRIKKITYCSNEYPTSHFHLSSNTLGKYFNLHPKTKLFVTIRDLRDACISAVYYIDVDKDFATSKFIAGFIGTKAEWNELSFDEKLFKVITADPKFQISFAYNAQEFLHFISNYPSVYVTTFENLVGSQGGGNDTLQKNEILQIAQHINIHLTNTELNNISSLLFGNKGSTSKTFRSGQIGKWKQYFKPYHIQAFKEHLGKYLIEFGYEIDNNW